MTPKERKMFEERVSKVKAMRQKAIEPYPSTVNRTHEITQVLDDFQKFETKQITIVGRLRSLRSMGKLAFGHLEDGTGRVQILFKAEELKEEGFRFLQEIVDLGDFLECTGRPFLTKTKEKTLLISSFRMLAKSLRALPAEHFSIKDEETQLRKRYLDILFHPEVKEMFMKKNKFWAAAREYLSSRGFLEMEMPVLENVPGGAEAEPFVTRHNALDRDFYLRISLELPLKKMLVAGYEKVFEIGRIFRNEGIDAEHLQDYTQLEFYWAYAGFEDLLQFVRKLYQFIVKNTLGTSETKFRGHAVNWNDDWPQVDYFSAFKRLTGMDLESADTQDLKKFASGRGIEFENFTGRGRLIDLIFKKEVLRKDEIFLNPCFLVNQPLEIEPLAKKDAQNPKAVQRMQVIAFGLELGKGFGELNDPLDQRARFEEQMRLRSVGDREAQMIDEDYLEAMEYGMPPAAGFGMSERFFAVLMDKSIRETAIFPLMKEKR